MHIATRPKHFTGQLDRRASTGAHQEPEDGWWCTSTETSHGIPGSLSRSILAFESVMNYLLAAFVGGFVAKAMGSLYLTRLCNPMLGTLHYKRLDDSMIPCWASMLHMVKLQVRKVACCR